KRPLAAVPFFPDESVWKIDIGQMVFAGDGILEGVAASFSDALGFERALLAAPLDRNPGLHQPYEFERRAQEFPGHAAQFAGEDLAESLNLLICRGRLHDKNAFAVAFMNGFRPVENSRALDRGKIDAPARAVCNGHAYKGATTAIFRVGKASEV